MRKTLKRIIAVAMAAVTFAAPAKARADMGDCGSYRQVASNATGGDWVGGRLMYETVGTVSRNGPTSTTTTTTTTTASVGAPGVIGGSYTTTITTARTDQGNEFTTQEPIGFYAMNDGSIYEIDCVTGEARRV